MKFINKVFTGFFALSLAVGFSSCDNKQVDENEEKIETPADEAGQEENKGGAKKENGKYRLTFVESNHVENYEDIKHVDDWEDVYPHQVESFRKGGEATEEAIEKFGEFAKTGHAQIENTFHHAYGKEFTAACLSCHSGDFPWIYEDLEDEVLTTPWEDIKDDYPETDFWSCYTCHGNEPGKILTTNNTYHDKVSNSIDDYDPGEATCGQCHTVFTGLESVTSDLEGVYDVHKNGDDLDGIFDALVEGYEKNPNKTNDALLDGVVYDEESGIKTYGNGAYLDLEMHQGSPHQKMGMSCIDCHMPIVEAEDGTKYRDHNVSESVFEKEEVLNNCMACHKSDEIETTDDLVAWTKDLQAKATVRYDEVVENLDRLRDEIIAGMERGVDEKTLDDARMAYARATYYIAYSTKTSSDYIEGHVPGVTSIHNYKKVNEYYDKAIDLANEHIDILKSK